MHNTSSRYTNQFEKEKIKYPKCDKKKQHFNQSLNYVCLSNNCKNRGLICTICRNKEHNGHNILPIRTFFNNTKQIIDKQKKNIQEENNMDLQLLKIQKIHIQMLTILKFHVQQLTEVIINCEKQIYNSYHELIKKYHQENNKQYIILQAINQFQKQASFDNLIVQNSVEIILANIKSDKKDFFQFNRDFHLQYKQYQIKANNFLHNIQQWQKQSSKMINNIFINSPKIERPQTANITLNKQIITTFSTTQKASSIGISNENKVAKMKGNDGPRIVFLNDKLFEMKGSIKFKVLFISANSIIGIGIGLPQILKNKQYKFQKTLGHGTYMITSNNYLYSHTQAKQNSLMKGMILKAGDQVSIDLDSNIISFKKKLDPKNIINLTLKGLKENDWKQLKFCVCLGTNGDKIQII